MKTPKLTRRERAHLRHVAEPLDAYRRVSPGGGGLTAAGQNCGTSWRLSQATRSTP
jgi:hypothetical protein